MKYFIIFLLTVGLVLSCDTERETCTECKLVQDCYLCSTPSGDATICSGNQDEAAADVNRDVCTASGGTFTFQNTSTTDSRQNCDAAAEQENFRNSLTSAGWKCEQF